MRYKQAPAIDFLIQAMDARCAEIDAMELGIEVDPRYQEILDELEEARREANRVAAWSPPSRRFA